MTKKFAIQILQAQGTRRIALAALASAVAGGGLGIYLSDIDDPRRRVHPFHHVGLSNFVYQLQSSYGLGGWLPQSRTSLDAVSAAQSSGDETRSSSSSSSSVKTVDFVVIGNGNAGRSAVKALQSQCPSASIAVVDPLQLPIRSRRHTAGKKRKKMEDKLMMHLPIAATGLDPSARTVFLGESSMLRYKHSLLVATGSRGAPPPDSLLDERIVDRVLELRPTSPLSKQHMKPQGRNRRPILSPPLTRQIALMASKEGEVSETPHHDSSRVCVLGSGWEAVELAVATRGALVTGAAGPLAHVVPRYLSVAITKRLKHHLGLHVEERSLVRYIAFAPNHKLELHTAKSYDTLDTSRTTVDLVVLAPRVDGPRGTAILPTSGATTVATQEVNGKAAMVWFQTWSQLSSSSSSTSSDDKPPQPSVLVCYQDDGRLLVNAQLQAASGIYAAGSVAKYPNSLTGCAHVAGEGSVDGARAGQVAAEAMAREYHRQGRRRRNNNDDDENKILSSFAVESLPVWRSDMCSYLPDELALTSHLQNVGIHALCVGNCDSERLTTHGFFWTNHSNHKDTTSAAARRDTHRRQRRRTLRRTRTTDSGAVWAKNQQQRYAPIFGKGSVYYLDRLGKIRGIMTWGLPFTDGNKELNKELVDRMKRTIETNGENLLDREAENDKLLEPHHLDEETRKLARLAVDGATGSNGTLTVHGLSRPLLHRYQPAKPANIASLGKLKRKDHVEGDELLGENIYIKDEDVAAARKQQRPPSLIYIYPWYRPQQREQDSLKDPYRPTAEELSEEVLAENERRARPPKEELLWLRRNEVNRFVNHKHAQTELWFNSLMRQGVFADGSDPITRIQPTWKRRDTSKKDGEKKEIELSSSQS